MADDVVLPESPCVRNCCLDAHDVCLGCGRSIDEILQWAGSDPQSRTVVLRLAKERLVARARQRRLRASDGR